jgi:hypothetical protein
MKDPWWVRKCLLKKRHDGLARTRAGENNSVKYREWSKNATSLFHPGTNPQEKTAKKARSGACL